MCVFVYVYVYVCNYIHSRMFKFKIKLKLLKYIVNYIANEENDIHLIVLSKTRIEYASPICSFQYDIVQMQNKYPCDVKLTAKT